jgi:hypothetical protein
MNTRGVLILLAGLAGAAAPAFAQEPSSRAEALRRERQEKAGALAPIEQSGLERALLWLENDRLFERLLNPAEGLYPKVGNVTAGSGIAAGPAYRRPLLFGGHADFSTFAVGSLSGYWMIDARLTLPRLADGRAFLDVYAQRYNFPSEDFFGLGPRSLRENDTIFDLRNTMGGVRGGVRPLSWLAVGAGAEYLTPRVGRGEDGRSIDAVFDAAEVPGLAESADFLEYEVFADLNYRLPRGNPRKGGRYVVRYQRFDDRSRGRFDFTRFEADVQQYVPIVKDRRVLALRGFASLSDVDPGRQVPFYLQRTLGGPDDLRGFRRFRFRDMNVLLLQAEYRWEIFTAVDGAIFYDAGKVASRTEDLTLSDLESDYGIGFRFGSVNGVFLRVEGAFGSAGGKHFIFRFGHVF